MNYKAKRKKAGLTPYMMSKELGIDFNKYQLVEKGKIALEGNLIDKFQEILLNAKMIKFNRAQRMSDIQEYIKDGKLRKDMEVKKYNGQELAEITGISTSEISRTLNGKQTNEDTIERIFDFLTNPINVKVEMKPVYDRNKGNFTDEEKERYDRIIKENNTSRKEVAEKIGYTVSSINNLFGTNSYISLKCKEKFVEYMNELDNKKKEVIEEPTTEINEENVVEETIKDEEVNLIELDEVKSTEEQTETINEFMKLLQENHELKTALSKAERQVRLYEKLIERL